MSIRYTTLPPARIAGRTASIFDDAGYRQAVEGLAAAQHRFLALDKEYQRVICPPHEGAVDRQRMRELRAGCDKLRAEIETCRQTVARERTRASRELCAALQPYHRDLAQRIAAALIELGNILEEEAAYRDRLQADEVQFVDALPPLNVPKLLPPRYATSPIVRWLSENVGRGLIDESVIPTDWRSGNHE